MYVTGGNVQAADGIYIRRAADSELLGLCREGVFAYVLAPRQVGKSSLMIRTAQSLADEGIASVIIDLNLIGTRVTAETWYQDLLALIEEQLLLGTDTTEWWQAHSGMGYTQRLVRFFKEVLLAEIPGRVVIFVDEIDATLSLDFRDDFFAALRSLYDARAREEDFKRLSFVLIGVATPSDLIRDPRRTPFNIGQRVEMPDFSLEEAMPLAAGFKLPTEQARQALDWVLEWTGGHPYLTQRLCQIIAEEASNKQSAAASVEEETGNKLSKAEVDRLVATTFFGKKSQQDNNIQFVRDMLTKRAEDAGLGDTVLQTYRQVRLSRRPVLDEEQSQARAHLKLSGAVRPEEFGPFSRRRLVVRNPIYRRVFDRGWINEYLPQSWWKRLRAVLPVLAPVTAVAIIMTILTLITITQSGELTHQRDLAVGNLNEANTARAKEAMAVMTSDALRVEAQNAAKQAQDAAKQALDAKNDADQRRKSAEAQTIALRARTTNDPETALLLAIEAADRIQKDKLTDVNGQVEEVLRDSVQNSRVRSRFNQHSGRITGYAFSPNGKLVASTSEDYTLRTWELDTGKQLLVISGLDSPTSPGFSPDGKTIAVVAYNTVQLFEADTGKFLFNIVNADFYQFSPDSKFIATHAGVYGIGSGNRLALNFDNFSGSFNKYPGSFEWRNDSRFLYGWASDKGAWVWDVVTGQQRRIVPENYTPTFAVFSPNKAYLATSGYDNVTRVWNTATGQELNSIPQESPGVVFSPNSQLLAIGLIGGGSSPGNKPQEVILWDFLSNGFNNTLLSSTSVSFYNFYGSNPVFSPDGRYFIASGGIWDVKQPKNPTPIEGSYYEFSPDSSQVVSLSSGIVHVYSTQLGKEIFTLGSSSLLLTTVHFSKDGKKLVGLPDQLDNYSVLVWRATDSNLISEPGRFEQWPNQPVFNRDFSRAIGISPDKRLRVWDTTTGQILGVLTEPLSQTDYTVAFSPDGKYAVFKQSKTIRLWEIATSKELSPIQGREFYFSQNSRYLVLFPEKLDFNAAENQILEVWDVANGQKVSSIQTTGTIRTVIFTPDSQRLISVSKKADKSSPGYLVQLWEFPSGKKLNEYSKSATEVYFGSVLSPDGKTLNVPYTPYSDYKVDILKVDNDIIQPTNNSLVGSGLSYSPNGQYGFVSLPGIIYDTTTWKPVFNNSREERIIFSPNNRLAFGWDRGIYELDTNRIIPIKVMNRRDINDSAVFSPDSSFLATSVSSKIQIWDTNTGKELALLDEIPYNPNSNSPISSLAFSPDNKFLFANSYSEFQGKPYIYNCDICGSLTTLLALSRTRVTRELSMQEKIQYGILPAPAPSTSNAGNPTAAPAEPTDSPTPTPAPVPTLPYSFITAVAPSVAVPPPNNSTPSIPNPTATPKP